jgi:Na+/H+ antiporter NhaD/arsenite permease-like protein
MSTSAIVLLVAVPLIVWRLYSRIRRLIGKQRSSLRRHWLVALFFPIIAILLMFANLASPLGLGGLLLGLAVGVALAIWGLKLTKFERAGEQFFYTPDSRIGIFIILLFIGRLGYRNFGRSPLTTVIFGVLAGFYCCYSIGLIRWRKSTGATN